MLESVIFMAVVGFTLAMVIALANQFFAVEVDPRIDSVEEMLPGANCGGCGFAGCSAFAKAVVEDNVEASKCPVCPGDDVTAIAEFLGRSSEAAEPMVALIKCCGDNIQSPERALYNGINDCNSAILVAGATKACQHGCLGLASCARACPFNAIEIDEDFHIAKVHPELCVGCGKCLEACPRDLIDMVPKAAHVHILCNSPEKAPVQRKMCAKGCIGCRKCLKAAPESFKMNEFLATVDYDKYPTEMSVIDVCPVKCIRPSVGIAYSPAPKPAPAPKAPADEGNTKVTKKEVRTLPCHKTLGVAGDATEAEVKKAFALKFAAYKPSKIAALEGEEKENAEAESKKVSAAYKAAIALAKKWHGEAAPVKKEES